MASRPARRVDPVELGIASFASGDQIESGDLSVSQCSADSTLLAAIDGIGHGKSAAAAAQAAAAILKSFADDQLVSLVQRCHDALRATRGVVFSLASIDFRQGTLTWLGVGNVQGVLIRSGKTNHLHNETLLLRPGVVGSQLPILQTATLPLLPGDTLAFATDGVRSDFSNDLFLHESPQRSADRILAKHCKGSDDALVFVARFMGNSK
ncbi:MAG TPA: SpoIIE family protein phosphatase [Candidatus Dormibacteraeota bacterium]|nr:SpoIIE family protein phosphatase [Candidatus Dormibacteraeota bacterium]